MIKGMDVMESEAAKFKFGRDKIKYSSSEHLEHFRQIQISCGMDSMHAVPLANCSDSGSSDSSSNSSGSSSSSSAVGTDTSNKTDKVKQVDATRDDSGGHVDATGDDGDEQVDATGDDRDKLNSTGIHILSQPPLPLHSNNSVSLSQKHSPCWGLYAGHDFHIWYRRVDVQTVA